MKNLLSGPETGLPPIVLGGLYKDCLDQGILIMTKWKAVVLERGVNPASFGRDARAALETSSQIKRGKQSKPRNRAPKER